MQQKPSTHEFGANVHYMNSKTREKNGLSLKFQKGAPTVQKIEQMSRVRARADQWYNVKKVPLYPSNPLDYVIIDSLCLFLRISDNLINLLILELRHLDAEKDKYLDKFSINNWE